jgi:thiamine kinase-like enzyme
MEKLNKISEDEKKVFHSIMSHEDQNLHKNFSMSKIKNMLQGLSMGLDFDASKIIIFCENLRSTVIHHNDIHPRNIMKDNFGNFKLIDFDRCYFKSK